MTVNLQKKLQASLGRYKMSYKSKVEAEFTKYEKGKTSFGELKSNVHNLVDELEYNFKTYPELKGR